MSTIPESRAVATVDRGRFSEEQVGVIKRLIAGKGASDDEIAVFLHVADKYDLDPLAKQIYLVKRKENEPAAIIISRDGLLHVADRHPQFAGLVADVVREGDEFQKTESGVEHRYAQTGRGGVVGGYALVYRRDRLFPFYFFAPWKDYGADNVKPRDLGQERFSPWFKYPSAMIQKVAEAAALKRAFSLSGLVAEDDLDSAPAPSGEASEADLRAAWENTQAAGRRSARSRPRPTGQPEPARPAATTNATEATASIVVSDSPDVEGDTPPDEGGGGVREPRRPSRPRPGGAAAADRIIREAHEPAPEPPPTVEPDELPLEGEVVG